MYKYKAGDRVRVKKDIEVGKDGVNSMMLPFAGKVCTIALADENGMVYTLVEDTNSFRFLWLEELLEPVDEPAMCFGVIDEEPSSPKEVAFKAITDAMLDTYIRKNHDYGDSFGEGFKEFGLVSAVIRLGDKYRRLKSLCKDEAKVKDEGVKDTLLDLANYAVMTLVEMEGIR